MSDWEVSKRSLHLTWAHPADHNSSTCRFLLHSRSQRIFQTDEIFSAWIWLHQLQRGIWHPFRLWSRQCSSEFSWLPQNDKKFGSSSALLNIASYLMIGLLIILIEFSFFKLYKLKYQHSNYIEGNDHGRLLNVLSKLKNWILFGGITRYILLGFVLINTASMDEINNYSMTSYRWSWWISLSLLLWIIIFVSFIFFVISIIQIQSLVESNLYNELINGIKLNKAAKFYTFVFLFHRILIIMFFMVDTGLSSNYKIISVLWVQSVYLLFLLIVRPYDSFKANLTKIIWEFSVLILCSLMLSYSTSSSWSSSTGDVFLYIMAVSCCLPIMIVSGNIFK